MAKQLPDMIFSKNKVNILVIHLEGYVEIELKTPDGKLVADAAYIVRKQDGEEIAGKLDESGYAKVVAEGLEGATVEFNMGKSLTKDAFDKIKAANEDGKEAIALS